MGELDKAIRQRDSKQQELELSIKRLVMELYRLQGKIVYKPSTPELNDVVKGTG